MEKFIVSARKYRPATFDTVVGQGSITTTLKNAIASGHVGHAYLFCGPRGVGKTTCARIFAKTINCLALRENTEACNECVSCKSFNESRSFNIHELDAASNNKVEDIRSLIDQVRIPPQVGRYSIYIIDEVHMLSASAFNAFLKTLEEPPAHAIFILATTEKHKIIPTILSRCQIFDFNRITVEDMMNYLDFIAAKEGIEAEPNALNIIAQKADGAMRDALTIFDQIASYSNNNITYQDVITNLNVLDYEHYFRLTDAFLEGRVSDVLLTFDTILKEGFDAHNFIIGLSRHFRDLLVCHDEQTLQLLEAGSAIREQYKVQSAKTSSGFLFECLSLAVECDINYKSSNNPRLHVELALIKMSSVSGEKKNLTEADAANRSTVTPEKKTGLKDKGTGIQDIKTNINTQRKEKEPGVPFPSLSSVSIRDTLEKINKPANTADTGTPEPKGEDDDIEPDAVEPDAYTPEQIAEAWEAFAESIKSDMPRMYSTLKNRQPQITGDNTIQIVFSNHSQADDFDQRIKNELLKHLRDSLKNNKITLDLTVEEEPDSSKRKPYTAEDKFKFMVQKNPLLGKLKQDFNLDFE